MLVGYREEHQSLLERNWIPEELLLYEKPTPRLYYPNRINNVNPKDKILVAPDQAFVILKDIDFIHGHSKMQVAIIDEQINIFDLFKELIDFAFTKLNLNRIYGYLIEDKYKEQEILQSVGFVKEGYVPAQLYWNQTFHNRRVFGLIKKDWNEYNG